jgi:hypothetical protein
MPLREPVESDASQSGAYVKRQLGRTGIVLTLETYGKWLPRRNKAQSTGLDDHENDSKVVASGDGTPKRGPQLPEKTEATR